MVVQVLVDGQPRRETTERGKNEKKLAGDFLKTREGAAATGAPDLAEA